jgi:uncharacterized membrane protein
MIGDATPHRASAERQRGSRPNAYEKSFSQHAPRAEPFRWASALAWFSVGLGVTQLLAPRALTKLIGVPSSARTRLLMRALGARELTAGVGMLRARRTAPWLWSRVGGDIMDLALLARLAGAPGRRKHRHRGRLLSALLAVAGVTALDVLASRRASRAERHALPADDSDAMSIRSVVTVGRPPAQVYAWWRNLDNLARVMTTVDSIAVLDELRSVWKVRVAGKLVEWTAEITDDRRDELIAWQTLEDADVIHAGEVRFIPAPAGRGTEIHVGVEVRPPAGGVGKAIARLGRLVPQQQVTNDLRRVKQVLEVGDITRSDASVHRGPHPGRPSSSDA